MTSEEPRTGEGPDKEAGEINLADAGVHTPMKPSPGHGGMLLDNVRVGVPVEANIPADLATRQDLPDAAVAVEIVQANLGPLYEALKEGAGGAGLDEASRRELAECVRKVLRGEASLDPELTQRLLRLLDPLIGAEARLPKPAAESPAEALTPRQLEVVKLLAQGQTNPEIAQNLVLSTGTVRTHVQRIMAKLGVSDRTGAVVRAIELGLITPKPND
jgi:DNA-binding NarL/FixJ family response regulator